MSCRAARGGSMAVHERAIGNRYLFNCSAMDHFFVLRGGGLPPLSDAAPCAAMSMSLRLQ